MNSGLAFYNPGLCLVGGILGGLGGILGTSLTKPTFLTDVKKSKYINLNNKLFR